MESLIDYQITVNEVMNNGSTVHLYYDMGRKAYAAYGMSAYIISQKIPLFAEYSEQHQMPMVFVEKHDMLKLKSLLKELDYNPSEYFKFMSPDVVDEEKYIEWASQARG